MYVFENQDIQIELETSMTLTSYTLYIISTNPSGTETTHTGTISGTTKITADIAAADLEAGMWLFQAKITKDGKTYFGDTAKLNVLEEFEYKGGDN